jgi:integrase
MPRRAKGPRLWFRPARRDRNGRLTHAAAWVILDSGSQISLGSIEAKEAEKALADYIGVKHRKAITSSTRDPERIPVADVITLYAQDVAPTRARPDEVGRRLNRVLAFFGDRKLSEINGALCRQYVRQSSAETTAKRDLEDLRAAINHHRREGLHDRIISVSLPERRPPRETWLTREQAAALLWAAWRRPYYKHMAKFVLVALYTGRRASVVCGASFKRERGRSWIDLSTGFLRPPEGAKITNKRNPPIPLPDKLLIHLRAWHRNGQRYVVEWKGGPTLRIQRITNLAAAAGLGHVTPHTLRHTAATWQMQAGTDLFEASRYLGMTINTLETVYAHHRPEHLTGAKNSYVRHRQRFASLVPDERAQHRQRFANGNREQK